MEQISTWEMLLAGALIVLVLMWWRPGMKQIWKESQEAENKDWQGVLIPIAVVVLFVILLIMMVS
jgi:cytochrome b561